MKALSARQAVTCETAEGKRCKCRCGGALHGAGRLAVAEEAAQLSTVDPHYARLPRSRRPRKRKELPGQLELDLTPLVPALQNGART